MAMHLNSNLLRVWHARRGSVAVHIGLMAVALIGMTALGTEIVFLLATHRQMQAAADAAALSSANAVAKGYPSDIALEARAVAAESGFVDGVDQVTVIVQNPPTGGLHAGNTKAVAVTISQPQTPHMVALIRSGTINAGARAVALVPPGSVYCMLALDTTASAALRVQNNGALTNANCGVAVNSSSNTALIVNNNAAIYGPVSVVGNWSLSNNAHLYGSPNLNHAAAIADPYASVTLQAIPACTTQSGTGGNNTTINLTPGHFCQGWNYSNNVTVNLSPGVYYIDTRLQLSNNFVLNGTGGVTIVINGNFAMNLSNNGQMNLTAQSTGPYAGLVFFGPRNGTTNRVQTFANNVIMNIRGAIYFPSQTIDFQNNGATTPGGCTQVIAQLIRVQNNVNLDRNCVGTGVQPIGNGSSYLVE